MVSYGVVVVVVVVVVVLVVVVIIITSSSGPDPSSWIFDRTAMWQNKFEVLLTVRLEADGLVTRFHVHNKDSNAFDFTLALHSYYGVR